MSEFKTDAALQVAVVKHMYTLMADDRTNRLDIALQSVNTWSERVEICMQMVTGHLSCSYQYGKALIEAAYLRILQVRQYYSQPRKLRSLLIFLMPRYSFDTTSASLILNQFSEQAVVYYQLEAPLAFATEDLQCAAIINRHLDSDLINSYNKKNRCESYLPNNESFMTGEAID